MILGYSTSIDTHISISTGHPLRLKGSKMNKASQVVVILVCIELLLSLMSIVLKLLLFFVFFIYIDQYNSVTRVVKALYDILNKSMTLSKFRTRLICVIHRVMVKNVTGSIIIYFFSVRRLLVLRGHSIFFIHSTTANDLRLRKDFLSQILSITFIFLS